MGILSRRKNKKYDYQPRYYNNETGDKPFQIKHKFDDHRTTVSTVGLKGKFNNAMNDLKQGSDAVVKKRIYIIIAILVLVFLWLIDFDLSIFRF
ncbi:riboflavin synthase subunit beta [Nonlabens xiamenensis]|uniref:riboflavin synthase subunit beta n=1 Tax=Nonlabens xiamenensis TaxID=2341043 RepID=UPI000F615AB0|nr:riboflavin synthase subunit beta [Nonlabens xiamenensis]